jgi:GGDEF domain-containing protein
MKLHVKIGYELLKDNDIPEESLEVLLFHQEKFDGSGYPFGRAKENIPLLARIYTVADAFEAMTARRIYKKNKSWKEAFEELESLAGKQFDPDIVPYAIKALSKLASVPWHPASTSQEIEKIRWSFYFMDSTGAIRGDLFLPTLNAFMEQKEEFCLTIFDIKNLSKINLEKGWVKGNEALSLLVKAINMECCSMYDIKETIVKLMKEDVLDIESPLIFRIGGDEFAVIAPFIPPPEKVRHVAAFMREQGIEVSYMQNNYPKDFKTEREILKRIMSFVRKRGFLLELDVI